MFTHAAAMFVAKHLFAAFALATKPLTTNACALYLPASGQVQMLRRDDLGQQGAAGGCAHCAQSCAQQVLGAAVLGKRGRGRDCEGIFTN